MIERTGVKLMAVELILLTATIKFKPLMPILIATLIFTAVFFRDPERRIGEGVVSPADGKIDYMEGRRIEIFMRPFDCHVNRSPVDGVVRKIVFIRGRKVPAFMRIGDAERNEIYIEGEGGIFKVVQIAGIFARRIVCYVKEGERVRKGQRIGMIRFGSRVVLEVPEGYEFTRSIGETVKAGETIAVRR